MSAARLDHVQIRSEWKLHNEAFLRRLLDRAECSSMGTRRVRKFCMQNSTRFRKHLSPKTARGGAYRHLHGRVQQEEAEVGIVIGRGHETGADFFPTCP